MSPRSVLVVSYIFPPSAGPSVHRTRKFVKFLPDFRWRPLVLTSAKPDYLLVDQSLLADLPPDTRVWRTWELPIGGLVERLVSVISGIKRPAQYVGDSPEEITRRRTKPLRIVRSLVYAVLAPDRFVGWIPVAVCMGIWLVIRYRVRCVYATGDPWSNFVIGYAVSRLTGRPLVVDFRDPWTLHPHALSQGPLNDALNRFWERRCVQRASYSVFTSETLANRHRQYHPGVPGHRFVAVPHGFDPEDFAGLGKERERPPGRFVICHVGTVHYSSGAGTFLSAIRRIFDRRPELKSVVTARFTGGGGEIVRELADRLGLEEIVETRPYADHGLALKQMVDADLLLLLNRDTADLGLSVIPLKTYEYLGSGRPILAITPRGEVDELIGDTGAGDSLRPDDEDGVVRALERRIDTHLAGRPSAGLDVAAMGRFERRVATGKLAEFLDKAAGLAP